MSSIYIAVGHGKGNDGAWDPGCVYGKVTEADLMLPIGKAVVKHLREQGFKVYSDADTGNDKNIATINEANRLGVDTYVSLHCDYSGAPSGTYPLYYSTSKQGKRLAECLVESAKKEMGIPNRRIVPVTDYFECRDTHMPAVIFETGSIKADLNKLQQSEAYGKAIAKGICKYAGVTFKEKAPASKPAPKPATGSKFYRVQTGAFRDKKNAEKLAKELEKKGYDTVIKYY